MSTKYLKMNNEEKYPCIAQVTGRAVQALPATVGTSQSQTDRPPQASIAGARHGGRKQFSSIKVCWYSCRRRFLDSNKHWTKPICLHIYIYIYFNLRFLPLKSDLRFPPPPTTQSFDLWFESLEFSGFDCDLSFRSLSLSLCVSVCVTD